MNRSRQLLAIAIGFMGGLLSVGSALADGYPNKPISLVVPFAAGGGSDQIARGFAKVLEAALPAVVVVENRPGASGILAAQSVARAAPDGYTLFMTTNTTQSAAPHLFKKLPYDPVADFEPITAVARGSVILVVAGSSPIRSVAELIAEGKKRQMTFGAATSSARVAAEMFGQVTGVKSLHVPYKAIQQVLTELIGGQIDYTFGDSTTAFPLHKAGRLRALGYAGSKRSPAMPEVPTFQEAGLKDFEFYYWAAFYAPKGTPPEIVKRLNEVLVRGNQTEGMLAIYAQALMEPFTTTPEGLAAFQRDETMKWGRVIKAAGIEPE